MVGFEMAGGNDAGWAFIDRLKLLYRVASIGDSSLAGHSSCDHAHIRLSPKDQLATGCLMAMSGCQSASR